MKDAARRDDNLSMVSHGNVGRYLSLMTASWPLKLREANEFDHVFVEPNDVE